MVENYKSSLVYVLVYKRQCHNIIPVYIYLASLIRKIKLQAGREYFLYNNDWLKFGILNYTEFEKKKLVILNKISVNKSSLI
jgi:hypothetical protein